MDLSQGQHLAVLLLCHAGLAAPIAQKCASIAAIIVCGIEQITLNQCDLSRSSRAAVRRAKRFPFSSQLSPDKYYKRTLNGPGRDNKQLRLEVSTG